LSPSQTDFRGLLLPGFGVVAENYYSGYYSQSITLPHKHNRTGIQGIRGIQGIQSRGIRSHREGTAVIAWPPVRQRVTFWQAPLSIPVLFIMTIIMATAIMDASRLITPNSTPDSWLLDPGCRLLRHLNCAK